MKILPLSVRSITLGGWLAIAGGFVVIGILALVAIVVSVDVPLPDAAPGGQATEVMDSQGKLIGTLRGEQKRKIVPMDQIAVPFQKAAVATEDRAFFSHSGISIKGIARALFTNISSGSVEQGGSTITQQYARNAYGSVGTERSILRKVREIALARKVEAKYSKEKILEFYLNTIYLGRGAYGAEAAALTYFKKPAKDLNLSESAYLAGAIRAPERFQPDEDPEAVVRIRDEVLSDMTATGAITEAEAAQAKGNDILTAFKLGPTQLDTAKAGFFMEHIRRTLKTPEYGFSDAEILGGGLKIHTSLDLRMQQAAEAAVSSTMNQPTDPEVALIAMDSEGRVKAMIGGRDVTSPVRAMGFNFAANVRSDDPGGRQAGSAFKPFTLAAFIEDGESLKSRFKGPKQMEIDSRQCRNQDGSPWQVSNFDGDGYGELDVLKATASSVNTVYAQMMDQVVTPTGFIRMAGLTGISIPERDEGCALTLGTTDVTPLEMARAYTTFAARGARPEVIMITRIEDPTGRVVLERGPRKEQVIDEDVADNVNVALQQVISGGTARGANIGRPAAGKTGTTQNHVDAWFAGYTPDLTAVVWMGFPPDDSGKIAQMTDVHGKRVTGGSFPAAIWSQFMREALKGTKPVGFTKPAELQEPVTIPTIPVCPEGTVLDATNACSSPSPEPTVEPEIIEPTDTLPTFLPMPPTTVPQQPKPSPSAAPSPSPSPSPKPSPSPTPSPEPSPTLVAINDPGPPNEPNPE